MDGFIGVAIVILYIDMISYGIIHSVPFPEKLHAEKFHVLRVKIGQVTLRKRQVAG